MCCAGDDPRSSQTTCERVAAAAMGLNGAVMSFPDDIGLDPFGSPKRLPPTVHPVPSKPVGLQLKVVLKDTNPEIWRRIEIPGDMTLDVFHLVLQGAMGWQNSHLHEFVEDRDHYPFITQFMFEEEGAGFLEEDFRVDQVLTAVGDELGYHYDFGDSWDHTITVEQILDIPPDQSRCLDGARACPPEDMGGMWALETVVPWVESGFTKQLEPTHVDADEYRNWLGDWHPGVFDPQEATREIQMMLRAGFSRMAQGLKQIINGLPPFQGEYLEDLLVLDIWNDAEISDPGLTWEMLHPFTELMELLDGGVKLTTAKYLPPAVVRSYATRTGLDAWWPRKITSESVTPLQEIREVCRFLGLLRVSNGAVAPTKQAQALRADPHAWEKHLRLRLPLGKTLFEMHAGWVALVVAGSGAPYVQWPDLITEVLSDIGWRNQDQFGNPYRVTFRSPTYEVLQLLVEGLAVDPWEMEIPEENVAAVAALARRIVVVD